MFAMLSSIFIGAATAYVQSSDNNKVLPDFIEGSIRVMYPDASDEKLAEVRAQWIEQLALNEQRIAETNRAVLKPNPTRGCAYMNTFIRVEDFSGGTTTNPRNVLGISDGSFARFYTPNAGQCATVVATASTATTGDTYVVGYRSSTSTGQYAIVYGSTSGNAGTWQGIGYAKISSTGTNLYFVGYAGTAYSHLAVGCNTYMGGLSTYNDFYLDCVYIYY